jgi:hypothetical protein
MIKVAHNLQVLAKKQASLRDELALLIPAITGVGGGLAGHHLSKGNMPISIGASLLGTVAGIPLTYLLSSPKAKKRFKKNPEQAIGSVGVVF